MFLLQTIKIHGVECFDRQQQKNTMFVGTLIFFGSMLKRFGLIYCYAKTLLHVDYIASKINAYKI